MSVLGNRSRRQWAQTGVAALALATTGVAAVRNSMGLTMAGRNSDAALRANGENAIALGEAALERIQLDQTPATVAVAQGMAQRALRRDPTNASALSVIGLSAKTNAEARRVFAMTERYTRRSLPTELFLIEDAVQRNDIDAALRHYDIALRTSRLAPSILFPVLVQASSDPGLLPAITRTLTARPLWGGLYLQQLAQSGTSLPTTAALFANLKRRGIDPGVAATATLYDRLIETRQFDAAWRVYVAGAAQAKRDAIRNADFAASPDNPAPFDWRTSDDVSVSARIERTGARSGELIFSAASGEGGEVARQMVLLSPGTHRIRATANAVRAPVDALPYLRMTCVATGADLGRQPIPAGDGRTATTMVVNVPVGCAAQWLSIGVQPPATLDAVEGTVTGLALG